MKTLENYVVVPALYRSPDGLIEALVGDQVKIYLDQVAQPGYPEYILGVIQQPITTICESRSYIFEYDEADIGGDTLDYVDILSVVTVSCCDVLSLLKLNKLSDTAADLTVAGYTEDPSVMTLTGAGTACTLNIAASTALRATLVASTTCVFTMPSAVDGKSFQLMLKQAAVTGNGHATFTGVEWGDAGVPSITATAGKMDILAFFSDGTKWYGGILQGFTP